MLIENQPLSKIEWVNPENLKANNYNPNKVSAPEMKLLKLSIIENGWTQPIVAHPDGEIIDGFHRWTLARTDKDIKKLTDNLCPVVRLIDIGPDVARLATVRHNRARGNHYIVKMSEIVHDLKDMGMPEDEIGKRLGMEQEEVTRLIQKGNSLERNSRAEFSKGWVPSSSTD